MKMHFSKKNIYKYDVFIAQINHIDISPEILYFVENI